MNLKNKIFLIINTSPESFSGDGDDNLQSNIDGIQKFGKDYIFDIGGQSTKPNFDEIDEELEIKRTAPLIKSLRANGVNSDISIDSYKLKVIEAALKSGANIINNVGILDDENHLAEIARLALKHNARVIVMDPKPTDKDLSLEDNLELIKSRLTKKVETLVKAGMKESNIIVDPGFGFSKDTDVQFAFIEKGDFFKIGKTKSMIGLSRKKSLGIKYPNQDIDKVSWELSKEALNNNYDYIRIHKYEFLK